MSSAKKGKQDPAASQGPSDRAHLKMAPHIATVSPESLVRGDEDLIIRGSALEGEVEILFGGQDRTSGWKKTVVTRSENGNEISVKAPDLAPGKWFLQIQSERGISNVFSIRVRETALKYISKTVKLPDSIWRPLSYMAIQKNITKHALIWKILEEYLAREKAKDQSAGDE